jgi:hypothetical protein
VTDSPRRLRYTSRTQRCVSETPLGLGRIAPHGADEREELEMVVAGAKPAARLAPALALEAAERGLETLLLRVYIPGLGPGDEIEVESMAEVKRLIVHEECTPGDARATDLLVARSRPELELLDLAWRYGGPLEIGLALGYTPADVWVFLDQGPERIRNDERAFLRLVHSDPAGGHLRRRLDEVARAAPTTLF